MRRAESSRFLCNCLLIAWLTTSLLGCPDDLPDGQTAGGDTAVSDSGGGVDVSVSDTAVADVPVPFFGCTDDQCEIDDRCWDNLDINPDNPCEICSVATDPSSWTADDGATCDDDDVCTTDDRCEEGECVGDGPECDDGNPCTDDGCDAETGECESIFNTAPCVDGDVCTEAICDQGSCASTGQPKDCDDGNPCTTDSCQTGVGCVSEPSAGGCDDGDACTTEDTCQSGLCVGTAIDCDDGDLCTVDGCQAGTCQNHSIAELCTDGNPCTDDECDSGLGCVFPSNTAPCDDQNVCTEADTCVDGFCVGSAVVVDDANGCTDDSCDPVLGPMFVPNTAPCFDGSVCTLDDVCANSICTSGTASLDCDDGNPCTDDACDPVDGCSHSDNTLACDDGSVCTLDDVCADGLCDGAALDCDDGNPCTTDSCDPVDGCFSTLVVTNDCRPNFDITFPARGATVAGSSDDPIVTVTGTVSSDAGPIVALSINDVPVGVAADGSFSWPAPAQVGGNILRFSAEDAMGTVRERVQSFLWSPEYGKPEKSATGENQGMLDEGLGIWFSGPILDDGDRSLPPDDFATVFKLVLDNFDIGALLGDSSTPLASEAGYNIYLGAVQFQDTTVALKAIDGGLHIDAAIVGITGALTFDCVEFGCIFAGGDSTGGMTVAKVTISADIFIGVDDATNELDVQIANANTAIDNLNVSSNNGWTNFLLAIIKPIILGGLVGDLEGELNAQLSGVLAPLLGSALGALAFSLDLDLDKLDGVGSVPIQLETDFQAALFEDPDPGPAGGTLVQRAGGFTPAEGAIAYDNLGVPLRSNCGGAGEQTLVVPRVAPLEVVLSDDALNHILYAAWRGGFLEFEVPPSLLAGVNLAGLGIENLDMQVSGLLAPTASDCNQTGAFEVHIGDLGISATLELFTQPMTLQIWASLTAGLELTAAPDGIGISITGLNLVATEVTVAEDALIESEGLIKNLIETELIDGLLAGLSGGALGNIPLPKIDLSEPVGLDPGSVVIAIEPQGVQRVGGNTIIAGDLAQ